MKTLAQMMQSNRRLLAATALAVIAGVTMLSGARPAEAQTPPGIPVYTVVLPDLRVTSMDADQLGPGQTRFEFWVKNEGTATANAFAHRVDIQGVGVWFVNSGSIAAGTTKYYSFVMASPPSPPNYRNVQVCADATGKAFELNESNNCLTKSVQFNADIAGG